MLRDAIKQKHDKAEKHRFVILLLSGNMPIQIYIDYLHNQFFCYKNLENLALNFGVFSGIENLKRSEKIKHDLDELGASNLLCKSSKDYADYLKNVCPKNIWAHIYVRHFADMYGGQIIKKVVPGAGRMYEFQDRDELIKKVRAKLSDDLADEANLVFDFNLRLFDELSDVHNI